MWELLKNHWTHIAAAASGIAALTGFIKLILEIQKQRYELAKLKAGSSSKLIQVATAEEIKLYAPRQSHATRFAMRHTLPTAIFLAVAIAAASIGTIVAVKKLRISSTSWFGTTSGTSPSISPNDAPLDFGPSIGGVPRSDRAPLEDGLSDLHPPTRVQYDELSIFVESWLKALRTSPSAAYKLTAYPDGRYSYERFKRDIFVPRMRHPDIEYFDNSNVYSPHGKYAYKSPRGVFFRTSRVINFIQRDEETYERAIIFVAATRKGWKVIDYRVFPDEISAADPEHLRLRIDRWMKTQRIVEVNPDFWEGIPCHHNIKGACRP